MQQARRTRGKLYLAFFVVAAVGVLIGFLLSAHLDLTTGANATPTAVARASNSQDPPPGTASTTGPQVSFVKLAKDLSPAVVHINVGVRQRNPFGLGQMAQGQGTGFIISEDGYILTNDHVVGNASVIMVTTLDERQYRGQVVGTDKDTDIALVKIDAEQPLPTAPLGDSDKAQVGEWVMAIGNPFGLDHTVTAGIISAKGRRDVAPNGQRSPYYDFLQTDASINPGNSGGPLFNMDGQVIGINSAVSAQGQGIGFAIPINMAKAIIPLLKKHGRVPRSYIGVIIRPVTPDIARQLGLSSTDGALIDRVERGTPAEKHGLERGDVIVEFDGKPIYRSDDLPWLASMAGIGRSVPMKIVKPGGEVRQVEVTLEEKPANLRP